MVIAASYPLLEVFWTMLIFFAFVVWVWMLFTVLADLFRRHDIGGGTKVLWIVFIVIAPYLGVFAYLIFQHAGMAERAVQQQQVTEQQLGQYVKSLGVRGDPVTQVAKAKELLDSGAITQDEFERLKAQALAG